MATKTEAPAEAKESKRAPQVKADAETQNKVLAAIRAAGKEGTTLKQLETSTGIRYRVLHNVTWYLEGRPAKGTPRQGDKVRARRLPGNPVRYVVAGRS